MMRFTLSDTGAGLQEEDLSNVFDPVRSGAASAVRGLYLAQQQSHSMGGDIGVHANQKAGRGLVVWFQVQRHAYLCLAAAWSSHVVNRCGPFSTCHFLNCC